MIQQSLANGSIIIEAPDIQEAPDQPLELILDDNGGISYHGELFLLKNLHKIPNIKDILLFSDPFDKSMVKINTSPPTQDIEDLDYDNLPRSDAVFCGMDINPQRKALMENLDYFATFIDSIIFPNPQAEAMHYTVVIGKLCYGKFRQYRNYDWIDPILVIGMEKDQEDGSDNIVYIGSTLYGGSVTDIYYNIRDGFERLKNFDLPIQEKTESRQDTELLQPVGLVDILREIHMTLEQRQMDFAEKKQLLKILNCTNISDYTVPFRGQVGYVTKITKMRIEGLFGTNLRIGECNYPVSTPQVVDVLEEANSYLLSVGMVMEPASGFAIPRLACASRNIIFPNSFYPSSIIKERGDISFEYQDETASKVRTHRRNVLISFVETVLSGVKKVRKYIP